MRLWRIQILSPRPNFNPHSIICPLITLYVLKGRTGKRYVGITNDLPRRLSEHHSQKTKVGKLLEEFYVIHTELFPNYKTARDGKNFLKSGQGRKWLDNLEFRSEPARGG